MGKAAPKESVRELILINELVCLDVTVISSLFPNFSKEKILCLQSILCICWCPTLIYSRLEFTFILCWMLPSIAVSELCKWIIVKCSIKFNLRCWSQTPVYSNMICKCTFKFLHLSGWIVGGNLPVIGHTLDVCYLYWMDSLKTVAEYWKTYEGHRFEWKKRM